MCGNVLPDLTLVQDIVIANGLVTVEIVIQAAWHTVPFQPHNFIKDFVTKSLVECVRPDVEPMFVDVFYGDPVLIQDPLRLRAHIKLLTV